MALLQNLSQLVLKTVKFSGNNPEDEVMLTGNQQMKGFAGKEWNGSSRSNHFPSAMFLSSAFVVVVKVLCSLSIKVVKFLCKPEYQTDWLGVKKQNKFLPRVSLLHWFSYNCFRLKFMFTVLGSCVHVGTHIWLKKYQNCLKKQNKTKTKNKS